MNEEIKENIRKQFQSAERKHVNINSTWVIVDFHTSDFLCTTSYTMSVHFILPISNLFISQ